MTFMSTTAQPPGPPASPPGPPGPLRMTPGRWAVLAVAVPAALALIGWTGFSLITTVARGSYPFSYTVPVDKGQVAVNVNGGNVTLRQGSASTARLTGTVQYGLVRPGISASETAGTFNLGIDCTGINTDCGMNAALDVPAQTGVTLWSNGGDVDASGFSSGMNLSTAGGNVTVSNLSGGVRLETSGGDLTANGLNGALVVDTQGGNVNGGDWTGGGTDMQLNTGGGDLSLNGLTGNFQLVTQGGNVNASGVTSATSTTQSGGGDVTLVFTQVPKTLTITAQGGNVNVILPPGDTKYDISTPDTAGGNVNYPSSLASSSSQHSITIDSGGGDISISQG